MDILILMFFGSLTGWLVSKPRFNRLGDIVMGTIGALASASVVRAFGHPAATGYNAYTFTIAMMGAVAIIYIGRSLQGFPQD